MPRAEGDGIQLHFKQFLDDIKQPRQHTRFGEILFNFIFRIGVACFTQVLRRKGYIPRLQVRQAKRLGCVVAQFIQIATGERFSAGSKFTQKCDDFFVRLRHAGL